jgi:uncharacterized protein YbjT (DUF2867 family)
MAIERILVVGAGGALGLEITRALRTQNKSVIATYRKHRPDVLKRLSSLGADIVQLDLDDDVTLKNCLKNVDGVVFIPILTASQNAARFLPKSLNAVFFSSNNVGVDPENTVYARLQTAEEITRKDAPHAVILRPTMIYGYPGDGNLSRLMKTMRKIPAIPIPGDGKALQQPVYYKDLAQIAIHWLIEGPAVGGVHSVGGPEALSQRQLYTAVAQAAGVNPKLINVPVGPITFALQALEKLGLRLPVSSAQLMRVGRDKTPVGDSIILMKTSLSDGLKALAAALDATSHGA